MRKISIILNASSPSGAKLSNKVISMVSCGSNYKITKSVHVSAALITTACTLLLCHCNHNELHIIWFTLKKSAFSIVRTISVSYKAEFITMETRRTTWILLCQERKFWHNQPVPPNLCNILANFLSNKAGYVPILCISTWNLCPLWTRSWLYIFIWSKGSNSITFFLKEKIKLQSLVLFFLLHGKYRWRVWVQWVHSSQPQLIQSHSSFSEKLRN